MKAKGLIYLLIGLLSLCFAMTSGTKGFCDEQKTEKKQKTDKYSPLLGIATEKDPFFPSRIGTVTGKTVSSDDFTSPEECKVCHTDIYRQWKGSMHSNAWNDPIFQAMAKTAGKETDGATDNLCIGCHAPVAIISGENPLNAESKFSEIASQGVFCDFCHTISETKGVGNLPAVSDPGDTKRGPFDDSSSPYHEVAFSEVHTTAEFCGLCHNMAHPVNGLPIEQTYTEWVNGPYRAEGVICQHCHMTPPDPPTAFTKNPGKPCIVGPEREHWWTHQFVGGNAVIPKLRGSEMHGEYAVNRLKAAAKLEIIAPDAVAVPELLQFKIKVSNVGCGHYLPTGLTEAREMWLDVSVVDADGKVVFQSGALDAKGEIDPDAVIYHTLIGDKNGKPTWKLWEATRVLYDYRIPPKGYRIEHFAAYILPNAKLPLKISATLNYRSMSPHLAETLLGDKAPEIPIIKMTQADAALK